MLDVSAFNSKYLDSFDSVLTCSPQRSNTARVRNMSRFKCGKLPGNLKHFFKKPKDKEVLGKRSFKL